MYNGGVMSIETDLSWYGDKQKKTTNKGVIVALTKSINLVQRDAKLIVRKKDGFLEDSIVKRVDPTTLSATTGTNMEYAAAQEFGKRSQPKYGFTPYLRPALKDNKANIKKIFIDEVGKTVD